MNYERILIVKPSAIGDVTTALPSLHSLRKAFPNARISWLIRKEFAGLLTSHPELDEIIEFDRRLLGGWWRNKAAFSEIKNLVKRLKNGDFDIVFDFQGLFRSGLLSWLTGSKIRFGMSEARELSPLFYTRKVKPPQNSLHTIDYYQKMVSEAGVEDVEVEFVLPAQPQAAAKCRRLLADSGVDADDFRIFVVSASDPNKCWQSEKFAALAERITAEFGGDIIAVGTKADKPAAEEIAALSRVPIKDLTGKTGLPELVALMHLSKLIISNDTGPGHIAIAANKPAVIIFGYTNPTRLYPYKRLDAMVVNDFEGRGKKLRSTKPEHSIKNVSVEQVYEKVLLQEKANFTAQKCEYDE